MSTDRQDRMTVRVCTCPLIDVSVQPHEPEFVLGSPRGCPTHGRDLDAKFAAAEAKARAVPRTWSLPIIPVGVKLRDERDGHTWERVTDVELDGGEHWTDGQAVISTGRLLQTRGRLTEVLEDNRA